MTTEERLSLAGIPESALPMGAEGAVGRASRREERRVGIVAYPDFQALDAVGPLEVLAAADLAARARGRPGYAIELVGPRVGRVRASSGLVLEVHRSFDGAEASPEGLGADAAPARLSVGPSVRPLDDPSVRALDTLVVVGGPGSRRAAFDPALQGFLHTAAAGARRVCAVCTGTFVLAESGLLEGRRVTTHWAFAETLAQRHPGLRVDPDAIYVRDGRFWTSAGVTAGMDLALALVEEDLGRAVALEVARGMVVFLKRPGGQSQFSAQLAGQMAERAPLRELQTWIVEHPEADLSIEALAARAGMSPRHFARVFRAEVGQTPGGFVECVRVEAARRLLEDSAASVDEVATHTGLGSAETLRRAFLRRIGVGPAAYRERFTRPRPGRDERRRPA